MTDTTKVLAQSFPTAATLTAVYTVPALTTTVISTITACNHSNTVADTIRISIAVAGAADATKQYIYGGLTGSGFAINVLDTLAATLGITLATTDVVRVYSTNGTTSFNIFGVEVT